jgi:hypothetical protein
MPLQPREHNQTIDSIAQHIYYTIRTAIATGNDPPKKLRANPYNAVDMFELRPV